MLLTISTTMPSAGDLGYLVHKHPDKAQDFTLPVGVAHIVWPEVSDARRTVALLEDNPITVVRRRTLDCRHGGQGQGDKVSYGQPF